MAVERFPVEAGHILMFARSIGDPNPIYADEEYTAGTEVGGIVAPPTFAQAERAVRPRLHPAPEDRPAVVRIRPGGDRAAAGAVERRRFGGSGSGGAGAMASGLHAEQHFEYHRHIGPGDVLSATTRRGDQWEKEGRSGKLVFSETITEYRDQNGELVITATGVGVRTERPVTQKEGE